MYFKIVLTGFEKRPIQYAIHEEKRKAYIINFSVRSGLRRMCARQKSKYDKETTDNAGAFASQKLSPARHHSTNPPESIDNN